MFRTVRMQPGVVPAGRVYFCHHFTRHLVWRDEWRRHPNGVVGEHIALCARIVAVADVFDALTSARPYKQAWPTEQALEFLGAQRGRHFDPQLVDAFFGVRGEVQRIQRELRDPEVARA